MAQYEHLPIYRNAFDLSMAGHYTQKAIACGLPVACVRQSWQYTLQMQLPQVKVSAA